MATINEIFLQHLPKKGPFYAAISGGVDSMVLLDLLWKNGVSFTVLHFNHNLRKESVDEEKELRELCRLRKIPFVSGNADVRKLAEEKGLSIESAARKARFRFFLQHISSEGFLLTAHHLEDQTESILLHMIRGSGMQGLCGMGILDEWEDPRIRILRPLLSVSKEEIYAYANEEDLIWFEDKTNKEALYDRNFLRLHVLPEIRKMNPDADASFFRLGVLLKDENDYLDALAEAAFREISELSGNSRRNATLLQARGLMKKGFLEKPIALQRRILRKILPLTFEETERIRGLFTKTVGKSVVLYGMIFVCDYDALLYVPEKDTPDKEAYFYNWSGEKSLRITNHFLTFQVKRAPEDFHTDESVCLLPYDEDLSINIRTYTAKDAMKTFGGSTKAVRKLFNEKNVASILRAGWPIVTVPEGILWIPGIARSALRPGKTKGMILEMTWRADG